MIQPQTSTEFRTLQCPFVALATFFLVVVFAAPAFASGGSPYAATCGVPALLAVSPVQFSYGRFFLGPPVSGQLYVRADYTKFSGKSTYNGTTYCEVWLEDTLVDTNPSPQCAATQPDYNSEYLAYFPEINQESEGFLLYRPTCGCEGSLLLQLMYSQSWKDANGTAHEYGPAVVAQQIVGFPPCS